MLLLIIIITFLPRKQVSLKNCSVDKKLDKKLVPTLMIPQVPMVTVLVPVHNGRITLKALHQK